MAGLLALTGCATLGGNVKGSFSCQAPDGICAPSSTIDDRALAIISGDAGDVMIPAGPYQAPQPERQPRAARTALVPPRVSLTEAAAPRTREKVLRIVFQPYIDDRGRLHEASAVRAVVQSEWQAQALADATPIPDKNSAGPQSAEMSLSDAVDRAAPGVVDVAAFDPNLPDPAIVAAARARAVDPIAEIKADVAKRLTPRAEQAASSAKASASKTGRAAAGAPVSGPTASEPVLADGRRGGTVSQGDTMPGAASDGETTSSESAVKQSGLSVESKASMGAQAAAQVKVSEAYRDSAAKVQAEAKNAAKAAAVPGLQPLTNPTLRAAGFPAAVPEDK
ncbi:TraV family lipoprotein [Sphingobium yanoikuyae]|uniref:TraV family lipoprotein n=1 Tax=Sphingobium yanoikuyae TaxID=13690 RepID=UPI0011109FB7|nr:TraV family lipoprotein [Sphingobium yanoikuyae]